MSNTYIKKIKKVREKKNVSQEQMAREIKVSRTTYIAIEKEERELGFNEFLKICDFLKIKPTDLIDSEGDNKREKYKQMLFSFLRLESTDGKIPKTKLAKLLYLADFSFFYEKHKSMSGLEYRKITYGPVPDEYFSLLGRLEADGEISVDLTDNGAMLISETRKGEKNEINNLNSEEKKLIKSISKKWNSKKTQEIVDFTHSQLPYTFADEGDIIPYGLITQEDPKHVY